MYEGLKPIVEESENSLAGAVYEALLEAIVSGRMKGGVILSEVGVAEALDVSRTPVNIAFKELAKDGLIERPANRRAIVVGFTPDDVFEIFEMRKYLEGPAAELAATRIDERFLAPMLEDFSVLENMRDDEDWRTHWAEHDVTFHREIYLASGNRRLAADIQRYRLLHHSFNTTLVADAETLSRAVDQHRQILTALEMHNGPAAREAMIEHIADFQKFFIRELRREQAANA